MVEIMTNDKTLTMSRELALRLSQCVDGGYWAEGSPLDELRALLAAPVVERRSVGHISLKPAPPELAELQATVAQLAAELARTEEKRDIVSSAYRNLLTALGLDNEVTAYSDALAEIKRLKGGQGEPVACAFHRGEPCQCIPSQPAPVSVAEKYDDVLIPFVSMMRAELHANAGKGDRPGWLEMDRKTALLEIFYHVGKLQKAVKNGDQAGIGEYAADVANMSMMLADVCDCLDKVKEMNQSTEKMCNCNQGRLPCECNI